MRDELITRDTAVLAKKMGFNIPCIGFYQGDAEEVLMYVVETSHFKTEENISAPTQSLLQRWLREEHNIFITINPGFGFLIVSTEQVPYETLTEGFSYDDKSYEGGLETALLEALDCLIQNYKSINHEKKQQQQK